MTSLKVAEPISIAPSRLRDPHLQVYVVFTDVEATNAALQAALPLVRDLNARLVLVVAKVVPYPLPLEEPPVTGAFTADVLSHLVAGQESDVIVRVYLCREPEAAIRSALQRGSLVVIGGRQHWGWRGTPRIARLLERDGHQVVLVGDRRIQPARAGSVKVESSF